MKRMNLGCGPDIKEGWVNTDRISGGGVQRWDARFPVDVDPNYDFILVNHVLCTMIPSDVEKVLKNCYDILKPGGKLQVIDMDLLKAFRAYDDGDEDALPIEGGDIDHKLCMHVSGYGTRLSLFTPYHLTYLLLGAGFKYALPISYSEHDLRPNESLIIEAEK